MAGVSYAAPWWVNLLHRLPHLDLRWETTSSQFRPEDTDYQQVTRALGQGSGPRVTAPSLSRVSSWVMSLFFQSLWTPHSPIRGPPPLQMLAFSSGVTKALFSGIPWSRLPPSVEPPSPAASSRPGPCPSRRGYCLAQPPTHRTPRL